jgi:cytidine deaminase
MLKQATGLDEDALAFALLPLAAACARADLSHFNVGAIARGVSGTWYFGGNMEFLGATMQQTVHAEQSAISHAWLRGEKALSAITVNYTPCGHCRQFMNELNSGLRCASTCRVARRTRWRLPAGRLRPERSGDQNPADGRAGPRLRPVRR